MKDGLTHLPVMVGEVIDYLAPQENQNFIDATIGLGGHAREILKRTGPQGKLMGFDRDSESLSLAAENLKEYQARLILVNSSYSEIKTKINEFSFYKINGIICDLGYSSAQVDERERGFSFLFPELLDLRYDRSRGMTGEQIINSYSEKDLARIFSSYGEERLAAEIAKDICQIRKKTKISGKDLLKVVERAYGKHYRKPSRIHPATKIWQAIRIEVNQELEHLKLFLSQAGSILLPGGKLIVITFHSLEDRIVKKFFQQEAKDCLCPKEIPYCVCGHKAQFKIISRKPILPSEEEVRQNPRSRSAKMRVVEKI